MSNPYIYLDYAASAPERTCSKHARRAYDDAPYAGANPNSLHTPGRLARQALEAARKTIAKSLGAHIHPQELYFTSGATESNNIAVMGLAHAARRAHAQKTRVIISAVEHESVLMLKRPLENAGFTVCLLRPSSTGVIDPSSLEDVMDDDVCVVSIMYANNETGVIMPIDKLAHIAHSYGAYMHTDAVQAYGHIPLNLSDVDAVSIAAHKIGGPVGIGALMLRKHVSISPLVYGGGQEAGLRSGTQAVCLASAFAAASQACISNISTTLPLLAERAKSLQDGLVASGSFIPTTTISYPDTQQLYCLPNRLPNIVSVAHKTLDAQMLILTLDNQGFGISSGSACTSTPTSTHTASHVLVAQGFSKDMAARAIRISFDERVPAEDLNACMDALIALN